MKVQRSQRKTIAIAAAIYAALELIDMADGGFEGLKKIREFVRELLHLPENNLTINIVLGIVIISFIAGIIEIVKRYVLPSENPEKTKTYPKARVAYLRWMKNDVENRLKNSVHHACYVELNLEESNDLVFPWTYQHHDYENSAIKLVSNIGTVIKNNPFSLLLLGAPGAGKTTTLLSCLNETVTESIRNTNSNIPLYANLSKWNPGTGITSNIGNKFSNNARSHSKKVVNAPNLKGWIIKIVADIKGCGLTEEIVEAWIDAQKITLFLDGLDETEETSRAKIVTAINDFSDQFPNISIFVCSRIADYNALVENNDLRLRLNNAVTILPLSPEQINDYLASTKNPQLVSFLNNNAALIEMMQTPLDLSIMVMAFKYASIDENAIPTTGSLTARRIALFDQYISAMIERTRRREMSNPLLPESDLIPKMKTADDKQSTKLKKYWGFIARKMSEKSKSSFTENQLFEYYQDVRVGNEHSVKYGDTVLAVLLGIAYLIISLFYWKQYPVIFFWSIVLILYFLIGERAVNTFVDLKSTKKQAFAFLLVLLLYAPAAMVIFSFIHIPFGYLAALSKKNIWIITILLVALNALMVFGLFSSKQSEIKTSKDFLSRLLFVLITAIPPVLSLIYSKAIFSGFVVIYFAALLFNVLYQIVGDEDEILNHRFRLIRIVITIAAIICGGTGIYYLHDKPLLIMTLGLQASMLMSIQNDSDKKTTASLPFFYGSFVATLLGISSGVLISLSVGTAVTLSILFLFPGVFANLSNATKNRTLLGILQLRGLLPLRFTKFLRNSTTMLVLKKSTIEYEFIHRTIRDYFAVREYVELFLAAAEATRPEIVQQIAALNDAGSDILVEFINDNDKQVRIASIKGLGKIGSLSAAKALFKAESETTGDLNTLVIKEIGEIKDFAAATLLLQKLDTLSVDSPFFKSCFRAIALNIRRIDAWHDSEKYKMAMADDFITDKEKYLINYSILKKQPDDTGLKHLLTENLDIHFYNFDIPRTELKPIVDSMNVDQLTRLIHHKDYIISKLAFDRCKKLDFRKAVMQAIEKDKGKPDWKFNIGSQWWRKKNQVISYAAEMASSDNRKTRDAGLHFLSLLKSDQIVTIILNQFEKLNINEQVAALELFDEHCSPNALPLLRKCVTYPDERLAKLAKQIITDIVLQKNLIKDNLFKYGNAPVVSQLARFYFRGQLKKTGASIETFESEYFDVQLETILNIGVFRMRSHISFIIQIIKRKHDVLSQFALSVLKKLDRSEYAKVSTEFYGRGHSDILLTAKLLLAEKDPIQISNFAQKLLNDKYAGEADGLLSAYFALTRNTSMLCQFLYRKKHNYLRRLNHKWIDFDIKDLFPMVMDVLYPSGDQYYQKKQIRSVKTVRQLIDAPEANFNREYIYSMIGLNIMQMSVMEIIDNINPQLAKEVGTIFFQDTRKNINSVLWKVYKNQNNLNCQLVIICILTANKFAPAIRELHDWLSAEEPNKTQLAIVGLVHCKDDTAIDKICQFLFSPSEMLIESTLIAFERNYFLRQAIKQQLFEAILKNAVLRTTLLNDQWANITKYGIASENIVLLFENDEPSIRYFTAIIAGRYGDGKMIEQLAGLLRDMSIIEEKFKDGEFTKIQTVSQAAEYALNAIGTFEAKRQLATWKQTTIN